MNSLHANSKQYAHMALWYEDYSNWSYKIQFQIDLLVHWYTGKIENYLYKTFFEVTKGQEKKKS